MRFKQAANKKAHQQATNSSRKRSQTSQPTKRPQVQTPQETEANVRLKSSDKQWCKERRKWLEKLPIGNNQHLDWKLLQNYGIEDRIHALLNVGPWVHLVEINEPAYREITLEFLYTFKFTGSSIKFQPSG